MPPFVNTKCPYSECNEALCFDLAELQKKDGSLTKDVVRGNKVAEEFEVTCSRCGRKFKFKVESI